MTRRTVLGAMLAAAGPYQAAAPYRQFVFESAPFRSCHASTIVETAPGEFLCSWFGGSREGAPDVAIWTSRRRNGVWSAPAEVVREPKIACYNPVLFHGPDAKLWLYYRFGPHPSQWTSARRWSKDGGNTWSPVDYLPAGLYGPIKNKPLVTQQGVILAGTSVESYHSWTCWVERSEDGGIHWTRHGPIVAPGEPHGVIQPTIVELRPGHFRMWMRATERVGVICVSDSLDGGRTWSAARKTALPNPNSGIDAVGMRDGRVALIYNHSASERTPLSVVVSRDGENWSAPVVLESDPGEYSYPAIIQGSDGALHASYTWQRKRIRYSSIPDGIFPLQPR